MKTYTLVTHNGKFHADDVLSCAVLQMILEKRGDSYTVIRTRDPKVITNGDFVFDIGGEYDASRNRFDHHQKGGAGMSEGDIPFASLGLVWQKFGEELCDSSRVAGILEDRIVLPVDADDNGVSLFEPKGEIMPYRFQDYLYAFRPTWKEGYTDENYDRQFHLCVEIAKHMITREIKVITDLEQVPELFQIDYDQASDKRMVILSQEYPWEVIAMEYPEVLFVVYPRQNVWRVGCVPARRFSFTNRKNLPASWGGLRNVDLQAVTGVPDAVFCHNGLFLAVAESKAGACALAKKALDA